MAAIASAPAIFIHTLTVVTVRIGRSPITVGFPFGWTIRALSAFLVLVPHPHSLALRRSRLASSRGPQALRNRPCRRRTAIRPGTRAARGDTGGRPVASASCVGAKARQMAAARAIDFTALVKDSITNGPSKPMSRQAPATSFHGTCPDPGAPRSFSHVCRCLQPRTGGANRVPDRFLFDVHVERVEQDPARRVIDPVDDLDRLLRQVEEARLEAVERLHAQRDPAVAGVLGQRLELRHEDVQVARALVGRLLPAAADGAVERTDHVGAAEHLRRVDAVPDVLGAALPDALVRDESGRGPAPWRRRRSRPARDRARSVAARL